MLAGTTTDTATFSLVSLQWTLHSFSLPSWTISVRTIFFGCSRETLSWDQIIAPNRAIFTAGDDDVSIWGHCSLPNLQAQQKTQSAYTFQATAQEELFGHCNTCQAHEVPLDSRSQRAVYFHRTCDQQYKKAPLASTQLLRSEHRGSTRSTSSQTS